VVWRRLVAGKAKVLEPLLKSNERRRTGRFRAITATPPIRRIPCIHGHYATPARTGRTAQIWLITRRSRVRIPPRHRPAMKGIVIRSGSVSVELGTRDHPSC